MSIPYYDVQVNYNSRTGLVEVWMFRGGWRKVMAIRGLRVMVRSNDPEIREVIRDLVRKLESIEVNL